MILAESVQFHPSGGGFDIIRGGITNLIVEEIPAIIPRLCLAYALQIPRRAGAVSWGVDFRDPGGEDMPPEWAKGGLSSNQRHPDSHAGRDHSFLIYLPMDNLELHQKGRYTMRVLETGLGEDVTRGETYFDMILVSDLLPGTSSPQAAHE